MSERGTFVTSYLYSGQAACILQEQLPKLTVVVEHYIGRCGDNERPVWFAGQIKGHYQGEELDLMEDWVERHLIPALPSVHGVFSIVVMPELCQKTKVFTFYCGKRYEP